MAFINRIGSDRFTSGYGADIRAGYCLTGGGLLVHEDDFVIREAGPEQLSPLASLSLPRLD